MPTCVLPPLIPACLSLRGPLSLSVAAPGLHPRAPPYRDVRHRVGHGQGDVASTPCPTRSTPTHVYNPGLSVHSPSPTMAASSRNRFGSGSRSLCCRRWRVSWAVPPRPPCRTTSNRHFSSMMAHTTRFRQHSEHSNPNQQRLRPLPRRTRPHPFPHPTKQNQQTHFTGHPSLLAHIHPVVRILPFHHRTNGTFSLQQHCSSPIPSSPPMVCVYQAGQLSTLL